MKINVEKLVKERDEAIIEAVVNDNWDKIKAYAKKYSVPIPKKENDMKAGIYKAAQLCTNIPQDIRDKAFVKCIKLGYLPLFR